MAQKLGELSLRKKFTINKLSQVGGVYFRGSGIKPGVQRGSILQKTLVGLGKGKYKYQFEKDLKNKYKVKWDKVDELSKIAYDDKKSGLSLARKEANLKRAQRDRIYEAGLGKKEYRTTQFAGSAVETKSYAAANTPEDMGAKRIGINTGSVGFAGGQTSNAKISAN